MTTGFRTTNSLALLLNHTQATVKNLNKILAATFKGKRGHDMHCKTPEFPERCQEPIHDPAQVPTQTLAAYPILLIVDAM
jgi:hypothetical protein